MAHSELQKVVLVLYRELLRVSIGKLGMRETIRREFRAQAKSVQRTDILHIESLLRRGSNQLKKLKKADNVTCMKIQ